MNVRTPGGYGIRDRRREFARIRMGKEKKKGTFIGETGEIEHRGKGDHPQVRTSTESNLRDSPIVPQGEVQSQKQLLYVAYTKLLSTSENIFSTVHAQRDSKRERVRGGPRGNGGQLS